MTIVPLKHGDKLLLVVVIHPDSHASMSAGSVAALPIEAILAGAPHPYGDALATPLRDVAIYLAYEEETEEFNEALMCAIADPDSFIPWLRRRNPTPARAWLADVRVPRSGMN